MTTTTIPFAQLLFDREVWPRFGWDPERVELFKDLASAGDPVPPIEVVRRMEDEKFLIADGVHRAIGAKSAGRMEIEVVVVAPEPGETPNACAFRRALETSTLTALPLSRDERRRAACRLLAERPDLSHRAVARMVGVSHDTVDRWSRPENDEAGGDQERSPATFETTEQVALRLAGILVRLDRARGIFDMIKPQRMVKHLADALEDRLGDDALSRARAFARWTESAVDILEDRQTGDE
jgi:ParB-like chromosome segregation protein Spo0J